jgi:hypothetical protein
LSSFVSVVVIALSRRLLHAPISSSSLKRAMR